VRESATTEQNTATSDEQENDGNDGANDQKERKQVVTCN
jgi:hypothetical protein